MSKYECLSTTTPVVVAEGLAVAEAPWGGQERVLGAPHGRGDAHVYALAAPALSLRSAGAMAPTVHWARAASSEFDVASLWVAGSRENSSCAVSARSSGKA